MLTRTFIKQVRELGFEVVKENDELQVKEDDFCFAVVDENRERCLSTICTAAITDIEKREKLLQLCFDYSNTSIFNRIDLNNINKTNLLRGIQELKYSYCSGIGETQKINTYLSIEQLLREYDREIEKAKGL